MRIRGVCVIGAISAVFFGVFAACGSDDSTSDSADGSTTNGNDASSVDGAVDGTVSVDGSRPTPDGSTITDSGSPDAMKLPDGGTCTPRVGGPFICGPKTCDDSTTQYCIFGAVPNECEPLPPQCQCEETFTCDCLLDNLYCDGGAMCRAYDDAGLIEESDASNVNFFWVEAHACSVK